jgi:Flp pilus assembly protein TadD
MSSALQNPHFKQARKLARQGHLLPAIEAFEKALGELPNDPTILFELAQVARQAAMLDIAIEMFRNTLKVTPGDAVVWRSLGLSQISAGRYEEAQQSFRQAIDLAGENPEVLCELALALQKSGKGRES